MKRFRYEYGAGPLHLLGAIASFTFAGYGLLRVFQAVSPIKFSLWFLGAIVAHDLILFPIYTALSLVAYGVARRGAADRAAVPAFNHLRVPALASGLLFVIWFPLILRLSESHYSRSTGQSEGDYLGRWLLMTGALFALSGLLYALRIRRAR